MGESLTEQRRVSDDGLRVVKLCDRGRTDSGIIGRKARAGGLLSPS